MPCRAYHELGEVEGEAHRIVKEEGRPTVDDTLYRGEGARYARGGERRPWKGRCGEVWGDVWPLGKGGRSMEWGDLGRSRTSLCFKDICTAVKLLNAPGEHRREGLLLLGDDRLHVRLHSHRGAIAGGCSNARWVKGERVCGPMERMRGG